MSIRILQLTDLHLTADPGVRLKGVPTHDALRDVVKFVATSDQRFDRIVITGDIGHDAGLPGYTAARSILGEHCRASHVLPGNHDDRDSLREVFADVISQNGPTLDFCSRAGAWRLIGLDTLDVGQVSGAISNDQLNWLATQLSAEPNVPTAIFMHHPPVAVGCPWLDAIMLRDSERFLQLVTSSQQVRVVCAGHVHLEFEQRLSHVTILTAPSTCVQFDPRSVDEPIWHHVPPGFRVLELHDDGFDTNVVRLPHLQYPPTGWA